MFRPNSQNLKVRGMKGRSVVFFADELDDVIVHTEHTFNILCLVVFYIRKSIQLNACCYKRLVFLLISPQMRASL